MSKLTAAIKRQPKLPRFLCHLYQRLQQDRLNLITGAGISIDAGVPSWLALLDRLSERSDELKTDMKEHRKTGLSPEYLGQILYHRHRASSVPSMTADLKKASIDHGWAKAIHQAIYKEVPENIEEVLDKHPYLSSLRDLVRKVSLVINFNFDDILSDAIGHQVTTNGRGKPYSVVWHPPLIDKSNQTTIYHVNGVLPRVSLKKRSAQLIFTEDSFADAMSRSSGVSTEYTFLRFVQNTMLIIGHSLSDNSLKNYLRQNKDKSPANHHYMIYWINSENDLTDGQLCDIFEANLELYNVITIFLTSSEIKEFLDLLNCEPRDFCDEVDLLGEDKRSRYHYYIVGPVASGKSTLIEHLRCFNTLEEWTRPPPPEMYLSFDKLDREQSKKVDSFIYRELKEKNNRLHDAKTGFHFSDRAPLDLYAFSKDDGENKEKTRQLKALVTRDKQLQSGEIIFIQANGDVLVERNLGRGRSPEEAGEASYFERQASSLKSVYTPEYIVDTGNRTAGEIAKEIARHVLLEDYRPKDLEVIMEEYL